MSKRTSETPQSTWLGGAQKGSLWLWYEGSLAEKRKSEISNNRRRPKPTPLVGEIRRGGALGRRECTDLGLIWAREKTKSSAMPQPWR